jgi:hypothetical protein
MKVLIQNKAEQVARRHHYVSQGYLAQFTDTGNSKGVLCAVDFLSKQFFRPKPKVVAFELDFNRIEIDGIAPDALETALGPIESRAIREIRGVCKTGKMPPMEAFSYVYNLITLFAVRTPALRAAMLAAETHMTKMLMNAYTASEAVYKRQLKQAKEAGFIRHPLNVSYAKMRDFVSRDAYTICIPTQRHIHTEFAVFNDMLDMVAQRYWSVMTVKPGAPDLITCDRPGPTRLGDKTIVFTISPRHALLGASEPSAPCEFEIDAPAVAEINAKLIMQAIKQIYSNTSRVTFLRDDKLISCDLQNLFPTHSRKQASGN